MMWTMMVRTLKNIDYDDDTHDNNYNNNFDDINDACKTI